MSTTCVLLSTYNGEKYLIEQLDSLRFQTRPIDEVIIKDDCSTDGTVEIIRSYIEEHCLGNWKLIVNEKNLGWKKNFVSMLEYVNTDYFFFCDQDDIWHFDKVEKMVDILDNFDEVDVLLSKHYPFYEDGREPKKTESSTNKIIEYNQTNVLLNRYPGCVICLRKSIIPFYKEYWNEQIPHDSFATLYGLARKRIYLYDSFTIDYRRHHNTTTHPTILNRSERIKEAEYYQMLLQLFQKLNPEYNVIDLEKWNQIRYEALSRKKPLILIKNIRYIKMYWSFSTFLMDWVCAFGIH